MEEEEDQIVVICCLFSVVAQLQVYTHIHTYRQTDTRELVACNLNGCFCFAFIRYI